jgi:hypothetical protein
MVRFCGAENIKWFIEDQAFSPNDLAPTPPPKPPHLLPLGKLLRRLTGILSRSDNLLTGDGKRVGEEPIRRQRESQVL